MNEWINESTDTGILGFRDRFVMDGVVFVRGRSVYFHVERPISWKNCYLQSNERCDSSKVALWLGIRSFSYIRALFLHASSFLSSFSQLGPYGNTARCDLHTTMTKRHPLGRRVARAIVFFDFHRVFAFVIERVVFLQYQLLVVF